MHCDQLPKGVVIYTVLEIRIRNYSAIFLKIKFTDCCPTENVQESWPTKIHFGWPNAEIGWNMANDRLLFLALYT